MAYREGVAWGSLVTMLVCYGLYFTLLIPRLLARPADAPYLGELFGAVLGLIILQVIVQTALAIFMRHQARIPADEREQKIALVSDRIALGVLSTAVACIWMAYLAGLPILSSQPMLANMMLLSLVLAALAKYTAQIIQFRRGA